MAQESPEVKTSVMEAASLQRQSIGDHYTQMYLNRMKAKKDRKRLGSGSSTIDIASEERKDCLLYTSPSPRD